MISKKKASFPSIFSDITIGFDSHCHRQYLRWLFAYQQEEVLAIVRSSHFNQHHRMLRFLFISYTIHEE
jgi:hypothetical protein